MQRLHLCLLVISFCVKRCHFHPHCTPGDFYCPDTLRSHHDIIVPDAYNSYLFKCNQSGDGVIRIQDCHEGGCSKDRCATYCTNDTYFCLDHLPSTTHISQPSVRSDQVIYLCIERGHNGITNTTCQADEYCYQDSFHSIPECKRKSCEPGKYYCETELKWLRSSSQQSTEQTANLYRCTTDGLDANPIQTCSEGCVDGRCTNMCTSGARYCAYMLPPSINIGSTDAKAIFTCLEAGLHATKSATCDSTMQCWQDNFASEPYCGKTCKAGKLYCGHRLPRIHGGNNSINSNYHHSIFKCETGKNGFIHVIHKQICYLGCQEERKPSCAKCDLGRQYCSSELVGNALIPPNSVYLCVADGNDMRFVTSCKNHCVQGRCCEADSLFCGSELPGSNDTSYLSAGLYKCSNGNFTLHMHCADRCIAQEPRSHCACESSAVYCANDLQRLGYRNIDRSNTIYRCQNESTYPVAEVRYCEHSCVQGRCCEPDSLLCGSELLSSRNDSYFSEGLYRCSNGTFKLHMRCVTGCIAQEPQSKCASPQCLPSVFYCGYQLQSLGFPNIDAHNIYACTNETAVAVIDSCTDHECIAAGYAHCSGSCTAHRRYCGYEDAVVEHKGLANRIDNALYLCTEENYFAYEEACRVDCDDNVDEDTSKCLPYTIDNVQCGISDIDFVELHVRGGRPASIINWPFIVSVQNKDGHICGGVLIDNGWVLTAAHCFEKNPTHIVHGQSNLASVPNSEYIINIRSMKIHRDYNKDLVSSGDIGLLQLEKPVKNSPSTQPVCLPDNDTNFDAGSECAMAGWGDTNTLNDERDGKTLLHGLITIVSSIECMRYFRPSGSRNYLFDNKTMICAGASNGNDVVPCPGDSGGPLFCKRLDSKWVLYGLVCCGIVGACQGTATKPSAFTKVVPFMDWIKEVIEQ